ncbi:hypothetical protein [Nostoc sp.]|uniref:hypothetical protein n=1 Tax=Nostoc sp. TaxID=1180 RepID=UPI002FF60B84
MNGSQSSENSSIVPQQTGANISLDDFKSLFYQLNAKPDTEIRLLLGKKTLELADIININEQIRAKLRNHDLTASIGSINFILSNKKIKDYSTWAEFERENWNTINERIQTVTIHWDFVIKLPGYQIPQRHSIKLRLGNYIPPKDMFQLILTSDNIQELIEARSSSICKVDFVNNIIAIELLNVVINWYEGLRDSPESSFVQRFFQKQGKFLSEIIRYASPIVLLIIVCQYSNYLFPILGIKEEISVETLQNLFIFLAAIFLTGLFSGFKIEKFIDKRVNKFEEYPSFSITRGDEKAIEEFENNNKKLTRQIVGRITWIIFSILVSSSLKFIIGYMVS